MADVLVLGPHLCHVVLLEQLAREVQVVDGSFARRVVKDDAFTVAWGFPRRVLRWMTVFKTKS